MQIKCKRFAPQSEDIEKGHESAQLSFIDSLQSTLEGVYQDCIIHNQSVHPRKEKGKYETKKNKINDGNSLNGGSHE